MANPQAESDPAGKLAYSIHDFCRLTGLSRSTVYLKIACGELPAAKSGRRTLIRGADAQRWLANLPRVVPS